MILPGISENNRRRQENAAYYGSHITVPGLILPAVAPGWTHVYEQNSEIGRDLTPERPHALMRGGGE